MRVLHDARDASPLHGACEAGNLALVQHLVEQGCDLRATTHLGSTALHKAAEGGLSKSAAPMLSELCSKYADAASVDKTLGVMR